MQGLGTTAVATSSDQHDEMTHPRDPGPRVAPDVEEMPPDTRRSDLSNPARSGVSADPNSQSPEASPPRSREVISRGQEDEAETGPWTGLQEGGQEPSQNDRAPSQTRQDTIETGTELPMCGICLRDASYPSVESPRLWSYDMYGMLHAGMRAGSRWHPPPSHLSDGIGHLGNEL